MLQQEDTGSCKSQTAHCTNQPNSFQSAVTPLHFQLICCSPANLSLINFLSFKRIPHSRDATTAPDSGFALLQDRKCEDNRNINYPWGRVADFTVCEGIKQSSVCPLPSCQGTEAAVDEMPPASNIFTALVMKKPQSWDFTAPWSE